MSNNITLITNNDDNNQDKSKYKIKENNNDIYNDIYVNNKNLYFNINLGNFIFDKKDYKLNSEELYLYSFLKINVMIFDYEYCEIGLSFINKKIKYNNRKRRNEDYIIKLLSRLQDKDLIKFYIDNGIIKIKIYQFKINFEPIPVIFFWFIDQMIKDGIISQKKGFEIYHLLCLLKKIKREGKEFIRVSYEKIGEMLDIRKNDISYLIKLMEDKNLIEIDRSYKKCNEYKINELLLDYNGLELGESGNLESSSRLNTDGELIDSEKKVKTKNKQNNEEKGSKNKNNKFGNWNSYKKKITDEDINLYVNNRDDQEICDVVKKRLNWFKNNEKTEGLWYVLNKKIEDKIGELEHREQQERILNNIDPWGVTGDDNW